MNEDLLIQKVLKLEEDVADIKEKMATKNDFHPLLKGQDDMMVILKRLDQERVFTNLRLDKQEQEIEKLKIAVKTK